MKITSFLKPKQKIDQQPIKAKTVENSPEKESSLKKLNLEKNGINEKIYKTLKANDIEPTKEMIQSIKGHFEKLEGTLSEKINALDLMLKKGVDVTFKNLISIHQTLNETIDYGEIFKNLKEIYHGKENIDYEKILNALDISDESVEMIISQFDIEQSLNENIFRVLKNDKFPIEYKDQEKLEKLVNQKPSDFLALEKDFENLLSDFEKNVSEVLDEVKNEMEESMDWLLDTNYFRKFLVEETTEKMREVKSAFDAFKTEITKAINQIVEGPEKQVTKENIEKIIHNFEKIIMKSDITLYTSMADEKELIQMASLIEEAKELLAKDETAEVKKLLINVKKRFSTMDFEPKASKVKAFMKEDLKTLFYGKRAAVEKFEAHIKQPNKGPRESLEIIRNIGINHEAEVVQNLEQRSEEKMPMENIKNMLMSLMTSNSSEEKLPEIKSTIDHITGQQLLSKLEVKSNIQQMTLNIPYMAENKIKSLDLFIQAKKEGEKIDWKNSTLYFVMDLNRYGKTGIKIQSVNKIVNMTVKNNDDRIKKETKPAFEGFLDELTDEGFKKGFIQYFDFVGSDKNPKLSEVKTENSHKEQNFNFEKGFDLKI
jgi:hypothetical protein